MRLHDLRHSYASRALALGESLPVIGKLLGHSKMETTARYSAEEAAERVAASIAADLLNEGKSFVSRRTRAMSASRRSIRSVWAGWTCAREGLSKRERRCDA